MNATTLVVKTAISEDLSLRNMASDIFTMVSQNIVVIDFSGIKSISRSFAQEYIKYKAKQNFQIKEINMPQNINKMFVIVENAKTKPVLIKNTEPDELTIV